MVSLFFKHITKNMSYTLGYEGRCIRCKEKEKAYYYFADKRRREMMSNDTFMLVKANCPRCVTSPIFQSTNTMEWIRKLSAKEVAADLLKLTNGSINIDWNLVDATVKENQKNDEWLENNTHRVSEYREWRKKKG